MSGVNVERLPVFDAEGGLASFHGGQEERGPDVDVAQSQKSVLMSFLWALQTCRDLCDWLPRSASWRRRAEELVRFGENRRGAQRFGSCACVPHLMESASPPTPPPRVCVLQTVAFFD